MTPRSLVVVFLALVFGVSSAMGVRSLVSNRGMSAPALETAPVVVAVVDIPRGGTITAELVTTRDYPKAMMPAGAIARVEDVVDRAVAIPLVKDEPVLDAKLTPRGAGRGLAALIPKGMRGFTIHTPSVASSVAGFILPGNKVDVLLTMDGKQGTVTATLLQNLEILAVDQKIDAPAENKVDTNQLRSVTLLVNPDQAAKLSLAQNGLARNGGSLQLSLRNMTDDSPADARPTRLAELEGFQEEPKVVVEAPKPEPVAPPPAEVPQKPVVIYRGPQPGQRIQLGPMPGASRTAPPVATDPARVVMSR